MLALIPARLTLNPIETNMMQSYNSDQIINKSNYTFITFVLTNIFSTFFTIEFIALKAVIVREC